MHMFSSSCRQQYSDVSGNPTPTSEHGLSYTLVCHSGNPISVSAKITRLSWLMKWYRNRTFSECHPFSMIIIILPFTAKTRDSAVSYSDWLLAGQPRDRISSPNIFKNFHFFTSSRPALGAGQHAIQWAPGIINMWVKRPGRETNNSPPTSAEIKRT
jgi:hypothetical protein